MKKRSPPHIIADEPFILKRSVIHHSIIELARTPLRGATLVSDVRWDFETTSRKDKPMGATVADIVKIMNRFVPPWLAEEWDNVGLQIGDLRWPVRRIWTALDPTLEVVKAACKEDVDLLITHHPLFFRPIKSIDFHSSHGSIIKTASQQQLAIFSAHTNLDIVREGVNDVLARRLGLKSIEILQPYKWEQRFKAGNDMVHDISPVTGNPIEHGIGRIGSLGKIRSLSSLALIVKEKLNLDFVKVAGNPELKVSQVAICSGSGSSLMKIFLASNAQVYISGDIHYHDARDAESANRAIIDIGHFASEHLVVEALAQQLAKILPEAGIKVVINACTIEKDPFSIL
jgi:dinuclear metal center YbgI/SA1388 family protein